MPIALGAPIIVPPPEVLLGKANVLLCLLISSLEIKVNDLTAAGVDDDYFYEEFGLPKGNKSAQNSPLGDGGKAVDPSEKPKTKNEKQSTKNQQHKKLTARELTFFEKLKDFFDRAPR